MAAGFLFKWATVVTVSVFALMLPVEAATRYSKAVKAGPARALNCGKGAFFDIKGECWKCPKGYKHANILLKPTDKKVCKKTGKTVNKKGNKVGKSVAGICTKRTWVSLNNGYCYKCPKGFRHNLTKFGNQKGVCYRKYADKFSAAKKKAGNLVCKKGFFDPIDKGSCWTCPAGFPKRTLKSVKSNQACEVEACGALNGRPCLITERIPSCDKGLAEDFIQNKCVKSMTAVQVCMATMKALKAGTKILGFDKILASAKGMTARTRKQLKGNKAKQSELLNSAIKMVGRHKDVIPELMRIEKVAKAALPKIKALFAPNTFCKGSLKKMDRQLASIGVRPDFKVKKGGLFDDGLFIKKANAARADHFFMSYSLKSSLAAGIGVTASYTFVTDYRGQGGFYVTLGPQLQGNVSADIGFGVQFYPKTNLGSFSGFGWDYDASGGPPSKAFGIGIDTSWGEKLFLEFEGFGVSGAAGVGVLPVDLALSATYTWPFFEYR